MTTTAVRERDDLLRSVLIGVLGASAGVHAAMAPHHYAESATAGVTFVAGAIAMLALAARLAVRPSRAGYVAAAVVLVGAVGAYALALLGPVPLVASHAEALSPLGVLTKAAEIAGLYAAINLVYTTARGPSGLSGRAVVAAAYVPVTWAVGAAYLSHGAGH